MLAAAVVFGPFAAAQTNVQLPSAGSGPVRAPGGAPAQSADFQSETRLIQAVDSDLISWRQVEGLPFAAMGTIVVEQTLADGSTIKNSYNVASWRDAEGRMRAEYETKPTGSKYSLRTVKVQDLKSGTTMTWSLGTQFHTILLDHMPGAGTPIDTSNRNSGVIGMEIYRPPPGVQTQTQDLPAETIAGLSATGVRTTTVISAGTAGNDRDLTVTSETWTSPDLKIVVRKITNDPRTAKVTVELTNITRTDPDPALFEAPEGYAVKDRNQEILEILRTAPKQ
jgi:hypothetical protein